MIVFRGDYSTIVPTNRPYDPLQLDLTFTLGAFRAYGRLLGNNHKEQSPNLVMTDTQLPDK